VSNGHFGTSAEMSWVRSVLGPKCPYTAATSASQYKKNKFNKMHSILVDNAAANEQLTVNITSNFPQYC